MAVTYLQINDAIRDTLAGNAALTYVFSADELKEAITDDATVQIYPESGVVDVASMTDRTTFGAHVRQEEDIWHIDVYARQRRHIGEDMGRLLPLIDAVTDTLEEQDDRSYFGLLDDVGEAAIKAFSWSWQRIVFVYGDAGTPYVGVRFVLTLRFF
jgi:hypothetical protein